jgi:hypothetical protein
MVSSKIGAVTRAHTTDKGLEPAASTLRVFLLRSPGAVIRRLCFGPCFRDATSSTDRENRAAHRCSHLL